LCAAVERIGCGVDGDDIDVVCGGCSSDTESGDCGESGRNGDVRLPVNNVRSSGGDLLTCDIELDDELAPSLLIVLMPTGIGIVAGSDAALPPPFDGTGLATRAGGGLSERVGGTGEADALPPPPADCISDLCNAAKSTRDVTKLCELARKLATRRAVLARSASVRPGSGIVGSV
jgi:hypothetical protein